MQTTEFKWGNPDVLKWGQRTSQTEHGTATEEAQKLRRHHYAPIVVRQLTEWEDGESQPELEHLETLAEIYRCPAGYFFLDKAPEASLPLSIRGLPGRRERG